MAKGQEEIHEFHAARRLNILKGFKEVTDVPPVPLKELQERVGKENVYTFEVLKGFTNMVLEKGVESERLAAKEQLNNLTPISVVDERGLRQVVYVEKGHMDFGQSGGGRQGLVKKQITDKTGRQTTKWVRANQDEGGEEKQPKSEDENADGTKPISEHAKETSSDDLRAYLEKNPDGEHATHAKRELQVRGELEGGDDTGGEGADMQTPELDYNDAEAVKEALANHENRDAIIDYAIEHGVTPGQALKMHEANKTDHSETHAAIDQAQASLDALKEKTGHPDTQQAEEGGEMDMPSTVEEMTEKFKDENWVRAMVEKYPDFEDFDDAVYEAVGLEKYEDDEAFDDDVDELEGEYWRYRDEEDDDFEDDEGLPDDNDPEYRMEMYSQQIQETSQPDEDMVLDFFGEVWDAGGLEPSTEKIVVNTLKDLSAKGMSKEEVIDIASTENPDAKYLINDYWPADDNSDQPDPKNPQNENDKEDSKDSKETKYWNKETNSWESKSSDEGTQEEVDAAANRWLDDEDDEESDKGGITDAQRDLEHAMDDLEQYYDENPDVGMPGDFETKWGERVSEIIAESGMTEEEFREITKKYQGLNGVIYSDYAPKGK